MREIRGFCTLCRSQCGTVNLVEGDRLVEVKPDPQHPTGAAVCLKGKGGPEMIAADNRLLYPMKRTRPKSDPDPGWARISWEEALEITASRLREIREQSGPESVAFAVTTKSGTPIADSIEWIDRFVRVFGSPNVAGAVDICNWHKDNAHKFTFGVGTPPADYANADLIILWGHNPTSTWLAQSEAIAKGRNRGAALIVVDPRATPLAQSADVWLQVRPGTDAALALGLSRLIIESGAQDHEFIRQWTNAPLLVDKVSGRFLRAEEICSDAPAGFVIWDGSEGRPVAYDTARRIDGRIATTCALRGEFEVLDLSGQTRCCAPAFELYAEACKPWTPEAVEAVTGVLAARLEDAAALISHHRKIAYHAWNGVGQGPNATQIERSIATLYALRGCFDDVGGNRIYAKQPINKVDALSLISKEQLQKALGIQERPLGPAAEGRVKPIDVYRAMITGKPYKIRAFVGFGTNHLMTQTDVEEIRAGLEACEFHVHCDMTDTPTAAYADVILPICMPWERESLRVGFEISEAAENFIQLRPAMVPPRGESRSDLDVVFDLACRLGMKEQFFNGRVEAGWNHMLAPLGISVEDLRRTNGGISRPLKHTTRKYAQEAGDGRAVGFATETRRVEFYSELLFRAGYSPLPEHRDYRDCDPAFPLLLTSMKNGYFCHSEHRDVPSLRKRSPFPQLFMHPSLAIEKRIAEGDWVAVRSRAGKTSFRAKYDSSLQADVMAADFGFWEGNDALGIPGAAVTGRGNSNFNALVSASLRDPISGSTNHKAVECAIELDLWHGAPRWNGFRRMRVSELHWETEHALRIVVQSESTDLPNYLPGQYVKIRVPEPGANAAIVRAYSLIGKADMHGRRSYAFCVGRDTVRSDVPGKMSSHLHSTLKVGDLLEVQAPNGIFTIPTKSKRPVLLIATGIGITPFIGYLESLLEHGVNQEVVLFYGNRNSSQHAFKQRLVEIQNSLPGLQIINFYSRPLLQDVTGFDFQVEGRIDFSLLDPSLISRGIRVYICGSTGVVQSTKRALRSLGVPKHDIFSELFVSETAPELNLDASLTFPVKFKRSGKQVEWRPSDGTLLSLAEKHGIQAPSGCRVGQCESCLVTVISGKVRHLHGQEPEEASTVLTCQAIPEGSVSLDL
ncbi:MAG: dmsA [Burkholderia sp.]|nr:dmsA [Burkholderia sp.]